MTLEEYARKYPYNPTEKDKQIMELESQLREIDYRNAPRWEIRQDEEYNRQINLKIRQIQEDKTE